MPGDLANRLTGLICLVFIILFGYNVQAFAQTEQTSGAATVVISELQVVDQHNAFVEFYNYGEEPVDISDWSLQYRPTGSDDPVDENNWSDKIGAGQEELETIIAPDSFVVLATNNFMNDEGNEDVFVSLRINGPYASGGAHLRLIAPAAENNEWSVVDLVGWGDADALPGGIDPAPALESDYSISRCFDEENQISNTGNNSEDFIINTDPLPGAGIECPEPEPEPDVNHCEEVILSEIGANLADDEQFIEIYNTSHEAVDLTGCQLATERSSAKYIFDEEIGPQEYLVKYISETDLRLIKTTYDSVYLLSSDDVEVDSVSYEDLKTDTSWALLDDGWRQTYNVTSGQPNVFQEFPACPEGQERNPDTGHCRNIQQPGSELLPCGPGRERNPETNRCRRIDTGSNLVPCGPDQERNPATNRCRKVNSGSNLVPCKAGQKRNPATNRCRSIVSSASALKPCKPNQKRNPETNRCRKINRDDGLKPCAPNQERNPETNRCRKVQDDTPASFAVEPMDTPPSSKLGWWFAGSAVSIAVFYALYEWRNELFVLLRKLPIKSG